MAATNKSLAQNNKSQTGGRASLPVMTAALCPSCSDLAGSRLARVNPGHHGSDEQMFGAKQQVLRGAGRLKRRFAYERRVNLE